MRNLQEQVQKSIQLPNIVLTFTVWTTCSSDLKNFANSRPLASIFQNFFDYYNIFFLTVGQNNFGYKIPLIKLDQNEPY